MQPLLECKDVSYAYHTTSGETPALKDISFQVEDGEFVAVVGPSGCGKSTLLSLMCRILKPETGSIWIRGKLLGEHEEIHTGYMPQKDQLFEWRNVYGNVTLGLEIQHKMTEENQQYAMHLMK